MNLPLSFSRASCAVLLALPATALTGNWPDFRGPNQDGHAHAEASLPTTWSESENVTWKTAIHGNAWSTPAIWGDQIWLTTATEDGKRQSVLCLDRTTGEILLDRLLFENAEPRPLGNTRNTYASPSPVIEEGRVYVHFGSYGTACLDTKSFETLWTRRDLPCHHWRGPASSPVLFRDLLILTFDGADHQYLAALDAKTGETRWRRERSTNFDDLTPEGVPARDGDYRKAFNTPIVVELGGRPVLLSPGAKAAWAYDPVSGDEIWSCHWKEHSTASRTVYSPELGLAYFNTGYGKSELWAVKLDPEASGEISSSHVAWKATKRMPNRCSPLLSSGRLYALSDQGVATCLDAATGEEIWSARVSEFPFSASLFIAGGHLYFCDELGTTTVVRDAPTYQPVAVNRLDTGMFASPATDGRSLFLRTTTHLYRIDH